MRKLLRFAVVLALLGFANSATPAHAQTLVADVGNFVTHVLNEINTYATTFKEIEGVYQRAQHIYQQYQLLVAEGRQLQNWAHNGEWHDMVGMYGALEGLMNQPDRLGYQTAGLADLLKQTYPGLELPTSPQQWLPDYHQRLRRGQTTIKEMLNVLDHISRMNVKSQIRLAQVQERVGNSDGIVQAIQSNSMLQSLATEDMGRIVQASLTAGNIDAIANAHKMQARMSDAALFESWLKSDAMPTEAQQAWGAVPTGWAW